MFEKWLEINTTILPRSRNQYCKVINAFFEMYQELTVENINEFLSRKGIYFYRFPFKHYLKFAEMEEDYKLIKKVKKKPKKRYGVYANFKKLSSLVNQMRLDQMYYLVAKIQFLTGSRAHDVLSIRKDNVKIKKDRIVIHMVTKGQDEHPVAIPFPEADDIVDYISTSKKEYPFMRGKSKNFVTWVNTNYRYYYTVIKKAAESIGLDNFATHDFRRNLANDVYKKTGDVFLVKGLLGHKRIEHTIIYLDQFIKEDRSKKAIEKYRR